MRNICLEIEYLGGNYFGFQMQKKSSEPTIQSVLEGSLTKLFKRDVRIIGSGRTDRGVHALGQVVNFKVETKIDLANIKRALNAFLPSDIRVKKIKQAPLDFHSRFWVKAKVYRYIILNKKEPSVFAKDFSWHIDSDLDLSLMTEAAKKLIGKKDFSLFAKGASSYKDCTREIKSIKIRKKGSSIYVEFKANGFLRAMVRNITTFLVKVGQKKISLKEASLILAKEMPYSNKPAPACGLYLLKVEY